MAGTKHKRLNVLSRRPRMEEELRELWESREQAVEQLEEFVNVELGTIYGGLCTNRLHSFACFPLLTGV